MGLLKPDYDRVIIFDVRERPRRVKICAAVLEEIEDLKETLADVLDETLAAYDGSFVAAYAADDRMRGICDAIVELAGLKSEQLDIALLSNLIFGWHDRDDEFHEGIIFRLARGETRAIAQEMQQDLVVFEDDERQTLEQYVASLRTRLITLGLAGDAEQAQRLLEQYTADEIEIMIDQRWQAVDPKGYEKAKQKAATKESIRKTLQQAQSSEKQEQSQSSKPKETAAQRTLRESFERTIIAERQRNR